MFSLDLNLSIFVVEQIFLFFFAAIDVLLGIERVGIQTMLLNLMSIWIVHPVALRLLKMMMTQRTLLVEMLLASIQVVFHVGEL